MRLQDLAVVVPAIGLTVLVGCTAPNPSPESEPTPSPSPVPTSSSRSDSLLEAHNLYRFEVGVPPLEWSESLANSSQAWADRLAATNTFAHSDSNEYGENLWKGTAGAYSLADMVKFWGDEKQYFIPDTAFPNLSTTGNWADVGHYTQIIWRDTTEVGCGLATGNGQDVLVCRYSPPGNYQGQKPF